MLGALLLSLLGPLWLGAVPGPGPPGVGGCVLCDPAAAAALAELLGPFLRRALPAQPAGRGRLGSLVLRGVLGLARLPRDPASFMGVIDLTRESQIHPVLMGPQILPKTSLGSPNPPEILPGPRSFMGVIDQATLDEASIHFRRTLARVMAQDIKDEQIYQELLWAMREIKEDFERLMRRFQSQVYCPNKCGRMEVVWIECIFCNLTHFACNRGLDCGERQLWVEEGQDLVLDCALPWHGASHGAKTYSFYRGLAAGGAGPEPPEPPPQRRGAAAEPPEPPPQRRGAAAEPPRPPPAERLLRSGPDPVLVRRAAAAAAAGRYRCLMRGPGGRVGSELRFNVSVLPRPRVPGAAPPPPAAPPGGLPPAAVAAIAVTTIATVLVAAGIAWFCFRRAGPRPPPNNGAATPPQ